MVVILPGAGYRDRLDAPADRSMEFIRQYAVERLVATAEQLKPKAVTSPAQADLL